MCTSAVDSERYIGIMSGTSMDGVDGALFAFSGGRGATLAFASRYMPPALRHALASLLCAAVDVTLVLDDSGTILDVAYGDELLAAELGDAWVGQRWIDTVTEDRHPKVRALLAPPAPLSMRWRNASSTPRGNSGNSSRNSTP